MHIPLWVRRVRGAIETAGLFHTVYTFAGAVGAGLAGWVVIEAYLHQVPTPVLVILAFVAVGSVLWCVRQILLVFGAATNVRSKPDYAYSLAYAGIKIGYDPQSDEHRVQLGIALANASPWPLEYRMLRCRATIGETIVNNSSNEAPQALVIPRMASRIYWHPAFPARAFQGKSTAIVEFAAAYGAPKSLPVRVLKMKLEAILQPQDNDVKTIDFIRSEREAKYVDDSA